MKHYSFKTCRILPVPRRVPENWKKKTSNTPKPARTRPGAVCSSPHSFWANGWMKDSGHWHETPNHWSASPWEWRKVLPAVRKGSFKLMIHARSHWMWMETDTALTRLLDDLMLIESLQIPSCGIHPWKMNDEFVPLATLAIKERHKYNQPRRDEKLQQWMMVAGTTPRSIDHAPWETLAVYMWRIVESNSVHRLTWYDTCTYLKELYPSQEAINIRCPKIKSVHNVSSPTRSIFLSSSCSREFQYTSRYSNLSLWGMKERKRCWGDLQVGTPFPWTPTQRSTDAPSIGPQWTFLLRDVPLERSETPELQTHEVRHRNDKKKAQCVLIIVPQVFHQDITVVLTCKHVVQCISKTLVGHHLLQYNLYIIS